MDIELLKTFLEVKKTRHFGKAAENLYLTQAAVSARIKQLENTLGGPLFSRYRNNLQLTATGERLVSHAETIIVAWDKAKQDVALKKKQKLMFALGGTSGLWDLMLQDTLHEVHRSLPELAIRAEAFAAETLTRYLMERTLDLAFIYEPAKVHELVSLPITSAELILVSSQPGLSPEQALASGYVAVDWGLSFNVSFSQQFPDAPMPTLHTSLSRIALDFVLHRGGAAYLPHRLVADQLDKSLFSVEEAPLISRQIFACHHRESTRQKEIDSILKLVRSQQIPVEEPAEIIEI